MNFNYTFITRDKKELFTLNSTIELPYNKGQFVEVTDKNDSTITYVVHSTKMFTAFNKNKKTVSLEYLVGCDLAKPKSNKK